LDLLSKIIVQRTVSETTVAVKQGVFGEKKSKCDFGNDRKVAFLIIESIWRD